MSKRFLNLLILFLLLLLSAFTTSELTREYIRLDINKENNPNSIIKIGQEGTFGLITNIPSKSIFNYSDIEEETKFLAEFHDKDGELYNFECRLWAPESMNIVQLCESNKNLTSYGSNQVPNYLIDVDDPYLYMNYLQNPSSWFLSPLVWCALVWF